MLDRSSPSPDAASGDELRVLLDTIPALVWTASVDGAAELFNRRWLDYTGLTLDEVRGERWLATVHPDDREALREVWQALLQSAQPGDTEARLRGADGRYRWFLFRCVPLRDAAGRVTGWCGTNTDIEEQKRVEADLQRSKAILDETQRLTHCGSMGFDVATGTVFWSDEGARIFGFDPGQRPTVEQVWERIHRDDRWLSERSVERARRGEEDTPYDVRVVMADGSIRHVRRIDPPGGTKAVVGGVCAVIDVTQEREAEAALQEAQAELARITRVTSLGELAASIAHEILQPIAAIVSNGEASLNWLERPDPDLDEVREGLESVIADGRRAAEIVQRIRALLKNARPEQTAIDVDQMLADVMTLIRGELVRRQVSLRLSIERGLPPVRGDRVQLQQVVINLILNGVQAMADRDGACVLEVRARRDVEQAVIEVEDRGGGIDPEIGDRVFSPFFTTKAEGMGMGLSICRSIVAAHGGRLWFTPVDGGTVFHFTLPLA